MSRLAGWLDEHRAAVSAGNPTVLGQARSFLETLMGLLRAHHSFVQHVTRRTGGSGGGGAGAMDVDSGAGAVNKSAIPLECTALAEELRTCARAPDSPLATRVDVSDCAAVRLCYCVCRVADR
jgi:hypothetical protein